jgi:multiple sugar transport system substrate-binding protein
MWSYGASVIDEDGSTVVINSPQTAEALEFVNELYNRALDPQVLSWDDASNNRFLISGKGSFILNPISAYKTALKHSTKIPGTNKPIYEEIEHFLPPRGPAGRHMYAFPLLLGIWSFAKHKRKAEEFIKFHFSKDRFKTFITVSGGYNQPMLRDFKDLPVWLENPEYRFATKIGKYSHTQGYPGPPTKYTQIVMDLFIIPDMFANVVTERMNIKDAMGWAEKEIEGIYSQR